MSPSFMASHYSNAPSRANSRPASPTRSNSYASSYNDILNEGGSPGHSGLSDYTPNPSSVNLQGLAQQSQDMYSIAGHDILEINLDSDQLVMRGAGGDMNPAYLSGTVDLNLPESLNVKGINMQLTGKSKLSFSDPTGGKSHSQSNLIFSHDWSFLAGDKKHTHTLKAGHHSFSFSLMLDDSLPSSITTHNQDARVVYRLRATIVKSGLSSNLHVDRNFSLLRTFTSEALEFNQTLEIENTWPGKLMYALTLPFKAYAAGDDIPVLLKFMPIAKGVKVTSIRSEIQEFTVVHTKHSQRSFQGTAITTKHELVEGLPVLVSETPASKPPGWNLPWTRQPQPSRPGSPTLANAGAGPSSGGDETSRTDEEIAQGLEQGDDEISTFIHVPIPPWTTPSHAVAPIKVNHKIKWSCSIANADGHVSELRCALPIFILHHSLLEEARAAGQTTRNLLFGRPDDGEARVDLPSYSNHVYDRVAVADSAGAPGTTSRSAPSRDHTPPASRGPSRPSSPVGGRRSDDNEVPPRRELSSWADEELLLSLGALQAHSNDNSPGDSAPQSRGGGLFSRSGRSSRPASRPTSRPNSRPASPERRSSTSSGQELRGDPQSRGSGGSHASNGHNGNGYNQVHAHNPSHGHGHGHHFKLHLPHSLNPLRAGSHKNILKNSSFTSLDSAHSTGASRANPMVRSASSSSSLQPSMPSGTNLSAEPFSNNPHTHSPPISGMSTPGSRAGGTGHVTFASDCCPQAHSSAQGSRRSSRFHLASTPDEESHDPLNQVPSYAVASRGFLGGGVVPLDQGLPTYDASERSTANSRRSSFSSSMIRPMSDTSLVNFHHEASEDGAAGEGTLGQAIEGH